MNPDDIKLTTVRHNFDYEVKCREIDNCSDVEELKNISKCFIKLYLKQQETLNVLKH